MWLDDLLHQSHKIFIFHETEMRQNLASLTYSCWRIVKGRLSPPNLPTFVTGVYPVDESSCHCGNRAHVMMELQIVRLQVSLNSLFSALCSCEVSGYDSFISHREKSRLLQRVIENKSGWGGMGGLLLERVRVFTVEIGKIFLGKAFFSLIPVHVFPGHRVPTYYT